MAHRRPQSVRGTIKRLTRPGIRELVLSVLVVYYLASMALLQRGVWFALALSGMFMSAFAVVNLSIAAEPERFYYAPVSRVLGLSGGVIALALGVVVLAVDVSRLI
jgi:hypothetical protein